MQAVPPAWEGSCAQNWKVAYWPIAAARSVGGGCNGLIRIKRCTCHQLAPSQFLVSTTAITRGELIRYLAEIAFAPDIILCNADIRWRSEGPEQLVVSDGVGDTAAEVTLCFDGERAHCDRLG